MAIMEREVETEFQELVAALQAMAPEEPTNVLQVIDRHGDLEIAWTRNDPVALRKAKKLYNSLVGKAKYKAFRMDADGHSGEAVREFNPEHERLVLRPQPVGG